MISYVSDVSTDHSRTSRIAVVYGAGSVGTFISFTLSGILLESSGFVVVYSLCIFLNLLGILYVSLGFPDVNRRPANKDKDAEGHKETESVSKGGSKDSANEYDHKTTADDKDVAPESMASGEDNFRGHVQENDNQDNSDHNEEGVVNESDKEKIILDDMQAADDTSGFKKLSNCCSKFFNIQHAKEAVMVTLKKRQNNHRMHVIVLIAIVLFVILGNRE